MARLYEMWVLKKLRSAYGNEIKFQVAGYRTHVDYIKTGYDKWIIDAKYKPKYENSNAGIIDDIREISGYARDTKILKCLGISSDDKEIRCLIVYPETQYFVNDEDDEKDECKSVEKFSNDLESNCSKIRMFRNFYKISVPMPFKTE